MRTYTDQIVNRVTFPPPVFCFPKLKGPIRLVPVNVPGADISAPRIWSFRMVRTPWGHSSELRERKLPPGRGTPREEAERNQRERLFAAMVATVAEKGYE